MQEFSNLPEMGTAAVLKLLTDADLNELLDLLVFFPTIACVIRLRHKFVIRNEVFKEIWVVIYGSFYECTVQTKQTLSANM